MNVEHAKTPWWIRCSLPLATWKRRTSDPIVYLTFDDSPSPVTSEILSCLRHYQAQATFFCIGNNAIQTPHLLKEILADQHLVGNHTLSHVNGWETSHHEYLQEVQNCQSELSNLGAPGCRLFRPPFGRMTWRQMVALRRKYQLVMWDVMAMDYRPELDTAQVVENVVNNCRPGSIVLLHDSVLAAGRILPALPTILTRLAERGFGFRTLE